MKSLGSRVWREASSRWSARPAKHTMILLALMVVALGAWSADGLMAQQGEPGSPSGSRPAGPGATPPEREGAGTEPAESTARVDGAAAIGVYPKTWLEFLAPSSAEAEIVDSRYTSSSLLADLLSDFRRGPEEHLLREYLDGPRRWARLNPPGSITECFPGVTFYVTTGKGSRHDLLGVRQDKFYPLPRAVATLLHDCGMKFEVADIPAWTRVLVYFFLADARIGSSGSGQPHGLEARWAVLARDSTLAGLSPATPEFAIDSIWIDSLDFHGFGLVTAYVKVDGQHMKLEIGTQGHFLDSPSIVLPLGAAAYEVYPWCIGIDAPTHGALDYPPPAK